MPQRAGFLLRKEALTAALAPASIVGMAVDTTAARDLADLRLQLAAETSLDRFVARRRRTNPPRSWRLIARDYYEATGYDVSHEAFRNWYGTKEPVR